MPRRTDRATAERLRRAAHRAVGDPIKLASAMRVVRAALYRGSVTLDELTPLPDSGDQEPRQDVRRDVSDAVDPGNVNWTHHRARVAALTRDRAPDDPELVAARQQLDQAVALRAIDDPEQLKRAAHIVRTAIERKRLAASDLKV